MSDTRFGRPGGELPEDSRDLRAIIELIQAYSRRLRDESLRLAKILDRLDKDGLGPATVLAEQRAELAIIEDLLTRLKFWSEREEALRTGAQ